jgi:septum formation protein
LFSKGLILASTSPYRRLLLARLGLPFECVAPAADEVRLPGEPAAQMAARLACLKAEAVARLYPAAVVIGSDQVALRGTEVLGKPGTIERCREQLLQSSGQAVIFLTAVHVIDGPSGRSEAHTDRTVVQFRHLSPAEIDRYIERDQPLDCAGGFKAEALGIALFERIESTDPTGLTGLPLSFVAGALRRAGLAVP